MPKATHGHLALATWMAETQTSQVALADLTGGALPQDRISRILSVTHTPRIEAAVILANVAPVEVRLWGKALTTHADKAAWRRALDKLRELDFVRAKQKRKPRVAAARAPATTRGEKRHVLPNHR